PIMFNFLTSAMWLDCDPLLTGVYCEYGITAVTNTDYNLFSLGTGVKLEDDPCGTPEGTWYTFVGNDSIVEVDLNFPFQSFSIYTGDCYTLICYGGQASYSGFQNFRFLAEFGQAYYIKFYNVSPSGDAKFRLLSQPRASNAVCARADTLSCGENVVMDFSGTA